MSQKLALSTKINRKFQRVIFCLFVMKNDIKLLGEWPWGIRDRETLFLQTRSFFKVLEIPKVHRALFYFLNKLFKSSCQFVILKNFLWWFYQSFSYFNLLERHRKSVNSILIKITTLKFIQLHRKNNEPFRNGDRSISWWFSFHQSFLLYFVRWWKLLFVISSFLDELDMIFCCATITKHCIALFFIRFS